MKDYSFHSLFSILISLVRIAVQACRKANPNYEEVKEKHRLNGQSMTLRNSLVFL